jgi:SAM-dependent methyltransferase
MPLGRERPSHCLRSVIKKSPIDMKKTHCRVCKSKIDEPFFVLRDAPSKVQFLPRTSTESLASLCDLAFYYCPRCSHSQISGLKPVGYYRSVIRASGLSRSLAMKRKSQATELISRQSSNQKFVEFGCGRGENLIEIAKIIPKSVGIEHSPQAIKHCRSIGLEVYRGFGTNTESQGELPKFESFGIFNFIEHLPNPVNYLESICKFLSPRAIGIIEVPNFGATIRTNSLLQDLSVEHLSYFSQRSLYRCIEDAGFCVLSLEYHNDDHIMSCTVQRRPLSTPPVGFERTQTFQSELKAVISEVSARTIALWGAGHQSMSTVLVCNLQHIISILVDSSADKQGRYMTGTDLLIQPPDYLRHKNPDLLLVHTSGYTREVMELARVNFPDIREVIGIANFSISKCD